MAKTSVATGASDVKLAYEEKMFREMEKEAYFKRFMGTDERSIVQVKTQLEKAAGDTIRFHLIRKLKGPGITGASGQAMEGNEEKLTTTYMDLVIDEVVNAVRDDGKMSRKRAFWDIVAEHEKALKVWGSEKMDQMCFDALYATAPTKIFYGGSVPTSIATLTATDKLTVDKLSKIKPWLKTGGNRAQNPLLPVRVDGKDYYLVLTHPDALYDLRQDSVWQQACREAEVRGKENPLFNGATAVWDGFIVHEHENIIIGNDGGSGAISYAKGLILGAQALCWGWGQRPELISEDFDYKRQKGLAFDFIAGVKKPKFIVPLGGSATDQGVVGLYTARTKISDA
jgi:N4-gp56 family major capsid protein